MKLTLKLIFLLISMLSYVEVNAESFEGTVHFTKRIEMGFLVSGVVKSIHVSVGQQVKKNQKLITLDDRPFIAIVDQEKANVKFNNTNKTKKLRDYKNAQELYDRSALSTIDLENKKFEFINADANYDRAQAQLKKTMYELDQSVHIAPFDALIIDIRTHANQRIINTFDTRPVIVLAAIGKYTVRIKTPLTDEIKLDQHALVIISNKKYKGRIRKISFESSEEDKITNKKLYEIDVSFSTNKINLRADQTAQVELL